MQCDSPICVASKPGSVISGSGKWSLMMIIVFVNDDFPPGPRRKLRQSHYFRVGCNSYHHILVIHSKDPSDLLLILLLWRRMLSAVIIFKFGLFLCMLTVLSKHPTSPL